MPYTYVIRFFVILALYYISGRLGLALSFFETSVTLVWPPTGIALAALLLFGIRYWPAIALGAFLVNYPSDLPVLSLLMIVMGNTLTAVIGVYLLKKVFNFRSDIGRLYDVFVYIVIAAMLTPIISSTMGVSSFLFTDMIVVNEFVDIWTGWWFGDAIGILIIGSLLSVWFSSFPKHITSKDAVYIFAIFLALILVSDWIFGVDNLPVYIIGSLSYVIFPLVIIASLIYRQIGAVTSVFIVTSISIWHVVNNAGSIDPQYMKISLLYLHGYLAILSATAMLIAASVNERAISMNILKKSVHKYKDLLREQKELKKKSLELQKSVTKRNEELLESNLSLETEVKLHNMTFTSLQRFRYALDSSLDAIYLIDPDKHLFVDSNKAGWELLGYTRDELYEIGPSDIKPQVSREELDGYFRQVCDGVKDEAVLTTEHQRKDESTFPVEVRIRCVKIDRKIFVIAIARDITEKKLADKAISESNERFRMLFDYMPLGVALADSSGAYTMVNQAMCEMLGYSHSELTSGMTFYDITYDEDVSKNKSLISDIYDNRSEGFSIEKRYHTKDGDIIWVNIVVRVIKDSAGVPVYTLGIHQDITEKRKSDTIIKESAAIIRTLIDAPTNDYFILFDSSNTILELNEAAAKQLGGSVHDLRGTHVKELFEPDVVKRREAWGELVKKHKVPMSFQDERNGRIFDISIYPVLDDEGEVIRNAVLGRDITQITQDAERRLANEIQHRETLVREVHHRIKNNLQSVTGLLRRQARKYPLYVKALDEAISQVEAIAVVYGLQGSSSQAERINLVALMNNIIQANIALYSSSQDIDVSNKLDIDYVVKTDEAVPLALVLNELITNAIKHTSNIISNDIKIVLEQKNNVVTLIISNSGTLPDNFDFQNNEGLGTGLSLIKSLVPLAENDFTLVSDQTQVVATLKLDSQIVTPLSLNN